MPFRFFHILLVLPAVAEELHETTSCLIQRQARPQIASMSNDILQDADDTRSLEQLLEQERQEIASLASRVEDNSTEHVRAEKQPWSLLPLESVRKQDTEQVADPSPKGDSLQGANGVKENSNFQQILREEAAKLRAKSLELQRLTDEAAKEDAEARAELERRKEERHLARLQREKLKEDEEKRILAAAATTTLPVASVEVKEDDSKQAPEEVLSTEDTLAQTLELLREEERTLKATRSRLHHRLPEPVAPTLSPSDKSDEDVSYSSMISNHLKNLAAVVHRSIKHLAGSDQEESSATLNMAAEPESTAGDVSIPMALSQVANNQSAEVATLNRLVMSEEHLANETASLKEEIRNLTLQEHSLLEKQRISTQEASMHERARLISEELLNQQKLLEREQALESKEKQAALQQIEEKLTLKEEQLKLQRREQELQKRFDETKRLEEEDEQVVSEAKTSSNVLSNQLSLFQNMQTWVQKKQESPSPSPSAEENTQKIELLVNKIQGLLDEKHKHNEERLREQ